MVYSCLDLKCKDIDNHYPTNIVQKDLQLESVLIKKGIQQTKKNIQAKKVVEFYRSELDHTDRELFGAVDDPKITGKFGPI